LEPLRGSFQYLRLAVPLLLWVVCGGLSPKPLTGFAISELSESTFHVFVNNICYENKLLKNILLLFFRFTGDHSSICLYAG